jgi:hypothetical protein
VVGVPLCTAAATTFAVCYCTFDSRIMIDTMPQYDLRVLMDATVDIDICVLMNASVSKPYVF